MSGYFAVVVMTCRKFWSSTGFGREMKQEEENPNVTGVD
jgi:hypothetical protein